MQETRIQADPWVRKIPWRRKWLFTPVFLPEKCHGHGSLAGYSPRGYKELDMTDRLTLSTFYKCFYFVKINLNYFQFKTQADQPRSLCRQGHQTDSSRHWAESMQATMIIHSSIKQISAETLIVPKELVL